MKFRTEIKIDAQPGVISYNDKILSAGSCFAENIVRDLEDHYFNVLGNPFGVLYNPASLLNMFELGEKGKSLKKDNLIFYDDEWHSFYHNNKFSNENAELALIGINDSITELNKFLNEVSVVIITLGTSYVYKHIERNMIVSNCHKIPQKYFTRHLLTVEENYFYLQKILSVIKKFNSKAKIVLTVSPVRHIKDGLHGNQLSKARLLLAVEKLVEEKENVFYFPSYEIMNDDLRDYRFYNEDLVHPNNIAVKYITEKFVATFFDEETKRFYGETEELRNALQHKFLKSSSTKREKFLQKYVELTKQLSAKYPSVDFSNAANYFKKQLEELKSLL